MSTTIPSFRPGSPDAAEGATPKAASFSLGRELVGASSRVLSRDPSSIRTERLQAAWVHFLGGYDWQWFTTCTFREAVHPERADKAFRYWVGLIDESRLGKYYRRKEQRRARWVRALEWQKRDVLHYHALVGNLGEYDSEEAVRRVWADVWNQIGGFAKVDAYQSGGVLAYVSKYVVKGGQIDCSFTLRPSAAAIWRC